jgi:hypothetical protein
MLLQMAVTLMKWRWFHQFPTFLKDNRATVETDWFTGLFNGDFQLPGLCRIE